MTSLVSIVGAGPWKAITYTLDSKTAHSDFATYALYELLEEKIDIETFVFVGTEGANWAVIDCMAHHRASTRR